MTTSVGDKLLEVLKRELLASATATEQSPAIASISPALEDYYKDSNYGLPSTGSPPQNVKIVYQLSGEEAGLAKSFNYPATAAAMFTDTATTPTFSTIKDIGVFVQKVAYLTAAGNTEKDNPKGYIGSYDVKDPDENKAGLMSIFEGGMKSDTDFLNLSFVKYIKDLGRPILQEAYVKFKTIKPEASYEEYLNVYAVGLISALRMWYAYQYIDHVPVGVAEQKYDSFLETQVRQLTKVVFAANLLRAAHGAATTTAAQAAIQTAFNAVTALPRTDKTMLGEFLAEGGSKNLDKMYKENVDKSSKLYDAATDLEERDAKMRQAQDNLRAINTNDELMTAVRRRAFIIYVVVWVMMAALVGALALALATGNSGVMYVTIAVVCGLVLMTEVTRGISRLLRV